ncbi:toll/interleukin-1 receptor domain-containing protein [Sorangium sp. So ce302]|uniref:toll/interleukin-1 receptor domain-containing protein n=1 Tax=Sorangium sp. So ce302 TaxID=3133297 RepID=UPI003F62D194
MLLLFEDVIQPDGRLAIPNQLLDEQLREAMIRHELVLGMRPMKIFLSHKSADKAKVSTYYETLKILGFDPWLDKEDMPAGTNLHRGILKGFQDSCAAIFFITPNFKDEAFLATEVDYAVSQKTKKGNQFAIITLVFKDGDHEGTVPALLREQYIFVRPKDDLDGLREVLRALPLKVGPVRWSV